MPKAIYMNAGLSLTGDQSSVDTGDLIVGGNVGIGLSDESILNVSIPRGSLMIESPAIDTISQIQQGDFPNGCGQLALVGGINEAGNTAGNGSLMVFCGSTRAAGTDNYRSFGMIGAFKENDTDGNRAGYLALGTRTDINPQDIVERMRITSTGSVIISNNTDAILSLNSGDEKDCLFNMYENDILKWTLRNQGDNDDRFHIQSSGGSSEKWFTIEQGGNVGIGMPTPTQRLDVSGNVNAEHYYVNSNAGASGSFTTADGKTVTVENGIITNIN